MSFYHLGDDYEDYEPHPLRHWIEDPADIDYQEDDDSNRGKSSMAEKEGMIRRLSELPDEVIATAFVYATDFTKLGVDVTQRWTTAQEQHNALSKAYYKGYYDAMKRINDHLE